MVEEELGGVGEGLGEGKEEKWLFFAVARNLKPATLAWPSWSIALIFCFGKKFIFHTEDIMLQIPTVKL